jgi:putative membrane protein
MDASLAPQPDAKHKEMVQKLQSAKAGDAFDLAYIDGQIDGHEQLLKIQEDYIESGKNREHLGVAKLARGMIKEHLVLLKEIQEGLKG